MRILLFFLLLYASTFMPWYVFFVLAVGYALRWEAYELLSIGIAVDSFYGGGVALPYYTIVLTGILVCAEWMKPYLRMYAHRNEA